MMNKLIAEYKNLLDSLIDVSEAVAGDSDHPRGAYAEALLVKFVQHTASMIKLYEGTKFTTPKGYKIDIYDFSSIHIIGRSALEALLMMHWLIIDPKDNEESDYIYKIWKLSGLFTKVRVNPSTENVIHFEECKNEIKSITMSLANNPYYNKLSKKEKKNFIPKIAKGEVYKRTPWLDTIEKLNLNSLFDTIYKHKCDHAHSGYLSTNQIRIAMGKNDQKKLCGENLRLIILLTAKITCMYAEVFPKCEAALAQNHNYDTITDLARQACSE